MLWFWCDSVRVSGWGGKGGIVYQKAYLEFFCSEEKLNRLIQKCPEFPSITYIASNKEGTWKSNVDQSAVNAVTWGVFPAKEIVQPTVVDPKTFIFWKEEAFEIWSRGWARLFPEADPSRKILEEVIFSRPSLRFLFVYLFIFYFDFSRLISFVFDWSHLYYRYKTATIWSAWSTTISSAETFLRCFLISNDPSTKRPLLNFPFLLFMGRVIIIILSSYLFFFTCYGKSENVDRLLELDNWKDLSLL